MFSLDRYRLHHLYRRLRKINSWTKEMRQLSDQALQAKTNEFKARLAKGESLDNLLPEAYAVVREAAYRVVGLFPYDVQVLGAIVLHQGNIAEMKTGEGKTLTATMPLYLNALTGKGVFLVTPNSYLAKRDFDVMGPLFRYLGLTVSLGLFDEGQTSRNPTPQEKRALYQADIHYTTNGVLGFDYLIDNLASGKEGKFLRPFHYAILDEADAVLLDTAQTPLIISGAPRVQSNLYALANQFVATLEEGVSYYLNQDEQEVWFTQAGFDEMERYFRLENIFDPAHKELLRQLTLALKGHHLLLEGRDYLVQEGQVKLLDKTNGRMLEGTKLQGGLHQVLETKENVELSKEMRAVASITYQNLFLLFEKLAGMTGTAKTAEDELIETYNMEVVQIPTHRPILRKDLPDRLYRTFSEKVADLLAEVRRIHATGQPILLVTGSVNMSEFYSQRLLQEGIPHNLLNAFHAAKEAQMIAEAGSFGNVTIATNMAGRGTDIALSSEVQALGGLAVICTERMRNQRMDLQVKGRAGRQGEAGQSQCFISLEDDLLVEYGSQSVQKYLAKQIPLSTDKAPQQLRQRKFHRWVQQAQEASEGQAKLERFLTLQFDKSVKVQRDLVYQERNNLIAGSKSRFGLRRILSLAIDEWLAAHPHPTTGQVERFLLENVAYSLGGPLPTTRDKKEIRAFLISRLVKGLDEKKALLDFEDFRSFMRIAILKAVDEAWIEEVDYLQQLRIVVAGRQTAQRNPIYEYHKEALRSFERMKKDIRVLVVRNLLLSEVTYTENRELEIYFN